jgi:putative methyltransferase (TIGR04325 family)
MINLSFLKRHKQDKPQFGVFGDYPSWEAALADSAPYKTDLKIYHNICDRIRAGKAASGRNPMPLLAGLALLQGPAHVLDFGGNLGMMYFEIDRLAPGKIASWHIADLPEVASYGNANLAGDKLRFITDWASERPNLVLSSHALQCIERPYKTLSSLLETGPDVLILHELPVAPNRRFAVQHLLPELGGGEAHPNPRGGSPDRGYAGIRPFKRSYAADLGFLPKYTTSCTNLQTPTCTERAY